jgi:hypothetical protein
MSVPKFDPNELTVLREVPSMFGPPTKIYNYPASMREAVRGAYEHRPIWQVSGFMESTMFSPSVNPDNIARAFVMDGSGVRMNQGGGPDMFGIEWEYIPQAGGSMVRPGEPFLSEISEWREKIKWPDIESWDWERAERENKDFLSGDKYVVAWFLNGWFERLISWMDFEGAALALLDEDDREEVKEVFDKLSDLYIKIFEKFLKHFPQIDGFCIHDDWGSQKETFFSPALANEAIVPAMRKVTDYLHAQGKFCELHSCGQALKQVPNFIAAGWDSWNGQPMNDTHKIYELYGDKIIVGVIPAPFDPETTSEEEQRALAREYAAKFCNPDKPSFLNGGGASPAFQEELYIASRKAYSGE